MKFFSCTLLVFGIVWNVFSQTSYYVSGSGSDSNDGLTVETAFRTISKGADVVEAGGTVFIMNGTYNSTNGPLLNFKKSGTASKYITFKAYEGHTPKLTASGNVWNAININGNYVIVEGLDLQGNNANITYEAAYQSYLNYINGNRDWNTIANFNTNGITVGNPGAQTLFPHHVVIRNCKIHDFPGGGLNSQQADYVTFEGNTIYNNAWYMMYGGSGISILTPFNHDNNTSYRNIVRNNIVFNNKTLIPWAEIKALSDGNGIIIDVNIEPVYNGRTLVENNVSYYNGGSGIHAYKAAHVDIINNTAYHNGNVVGYPEIYGAEGSDVKIYNNIMYARNRGACNSNSASAVYDYNIYFNGPASRKGTNDLVADPKFITLAQDGTADFRLRRNSPAVNSGTDAVGLFSSKDNNGNPRPAGAKPDRGAYESLFITSAAIPQLRVKQEAVVIANTTGHYDFENVFFNAPKTVTFTLDNVGNAPLTLNGTPRVSVSGSGFSLATDAAATVNTDNSTSFEITLTTSAEVNYTGTITIASNDPYESAFTFSVAAKGMNPANALQSVVFNPLPVKNVKDEDFSPGATTASGLPIAYTSSKPAVATIVNDKIHIVGEGTTVITATQPGNATTHAATPIRQSLTVTPVMFREGNNLVANAGFESNTSGWTINLQSAAAATALSVSDEKYSSKIAKIDIGSFGTTSSAYNVQFGHAVSVVAGKTYSIMFKASASLPSWISLILIQTATPYATPFSQTQIVLTDLPVTYGPYTFTSATTQALFLRFLIGLASPTVYIDDVEMFEVGIPPVVTAAEGEVYLLKHNVFEVYPNPVADHALNVVTETRAGQQIDLTLIDMTGQRVYTRTDVARENGLNTFLHHVQVKPGLYFVVLKNEKGKYGKLVSIQ